MANLQARDSIGRNAFVVLSGQVVTWITTAVTLAIVPRYLGAHEMGVYSIGATFCTLATAVAGLGMGTLITREVARDRMGSTDMITTALWLNLALGLAAGTIAVAFAWFIGYSREVVLVVSVLAVTVPLSLFGGVVGATLMGLEIMRWNVLFDIVTKALLLFVVIFAFVLDLGLHGVVAAPLVTSVILFAWQVKVIRRTVGLKFRVPSMDSTRLLAKQSMPFFLISVAWVLYTSIDVFLLSWMSGAESVGIYATSTRLFGTALIVPVTITTVLFPRISAMFAENSADAARLLAKVLRITALVSVLLCLATVGLSDPSIVALLGSSFADDTGPVVVALSLALIPTSMGIVASRMAFAANRQVAVSWIGLAAFVAKTSLGLVLIPAFGAKFGNAALGAAVGLVVTEAAMTVAMLKFLPAGTFAGCGQFYLRLGVAAACAVAVCVSAYRESPIVAGSAAASVYVGAVLVLRVYHPDDVAWAKGWLASRRKAPQPLPTP